jgi:MFS family permease
MVASGLFFLGAGALNALLPRYVVDTLDGTELTAGIVMGAMAISALVARPWLGRLADGRGARRVIVLGGAFGTLSLLLLALLPTLWGAVLSRLVFGIGAAAVVTASTLLSLEIAPEARRSEAASYVLIAFHVGMGLGPVGGEALLGVLSYAEVWLVLAAATGLGGAVARGLRHRPREPVTEPAPLIHPNAIGPGLVTLFGIFAFNGFMMFLPLYSREVGLEEVGPVFLVASITIVVARLVLGRLPDTIGPIRAGSGALAVSVLATGVVAGWAAPAGLFVGAMLLAAGLSLQSPSFMAVAVDGVPPRERGAAMATYTGFFDVANALIGPVFGLIVSGLGYRAAFLTAGALSVLALAILRGMVAPRYRAGRAS